MGRTAKQSLAEKTAEALKREIAEGAYPLNSRIPTEPKLMEHFGVGRSTVREAVRLLVNCGMLEVKQGSGTYCRALQPVSASLAQAVSDETLVSIYEARRIIEVGIVRLAAKNRTEEDIAQLRHALDERIRAIEEQDFAAYTQADVLFHNGLARATHNKIIEDIYLDFDASLEAALDVDTSRNDFDTNNHGLHEKIFESVVSGNADQAATYLNVILDEDLANIEAHAEGLA